MANDQTIKWITCPRIIQSTRDNSVKRLVIYLQTNALGQIAYNDIGNLENSSNLV